MIRHKKLHVATAFSLMTVAAAILCFGSLINFHQYKIWGKPLIPTFVGYKRDVEKNIRTVAHAPYSGDDLSLLTGFAADDAARQDNSRVPECGLRILFPDSQPVALQDLCPANVNGLRGPPLA